MALDGFVISNMVSELNTLLAEGRINKIAQPEKDELLLTIKSNRKLIRILISASATLPLLYVTEENKPSPLAAPNFCMLLRKHLNSAKILSITQPSLERIVDFEIEHLNELGDSCIKHLIVELMGKHSNIIFVDEKNMIIDSIKHVSGLVSSVREVLPGRPYFIPHTQEKQNPLELTFEQFNSIVFKKPMSIQKAIYSSFTGFSPIIANEICYRASLDGEQSTSSLNENERLHLFRNLSYFLEAVKEKQFHPQIIYKENEPIEFSSLDLTLYGAASSCVSNTSNMLHTDSNTADTSLDCTTSTTLSSTVLTSTTSFSTVSDSTAKTSVLSYASRDGKYHIVYDSSISSVLETYYGEKNRITRIRQKSVDLRKIVSNALDRNRKKYDLQLKQLKDTEKKDKFKIYGELITTYGYEVEEGAKKLTCPNYYTNEEITIPLDDTLSAMENAKKYFDKYSKLKRTFEAVTIQLAETKEELEHLESINNSLDIALLEEDLVQLKEELMDYGYIRRKFSTGKGNKKVKITSKPFHYISSDGYDMYVGKNNFQNEELTFKFASGGDWWFHAKGMAGSHVIVKSKNEKELPDRVFEEAGMLAAYYSKAKTMDKVEIDYTEKKNVKKPNGSKPGFVVYYTNYSLIVKPDISHLQLVES